MTVHTIYVSSVTEAIVRAREYFKEHQDEEWVLATGEATVGGLMFDLKGDLLLHRSEVGTFVGTDTIDDAKQRIYEAINKS